MAGRRPGPLRPSSFVEALRERVPELWRIARLELEIHSNVDSSDISPALWQTLARRIHERLSAFDGVVVTHGTDTMAYTAAALSFMLRNLPRPVVLTGSQVPIGEIRTDARLNLIDAVTAAARGPELPEVVICFDSKLFRGNRSRKQKIAEYDAFASPNLPPLGGLGVEVTIAPARRPRGTFQLLDRLETRIHSLPVFPGIDPAPHVAHLANGEVKGLVVSAFGAGNFPIQGPRSLLPLFSLARDRKVPVLVTSQSERNAVALSLYESGAAALELGAIGAGDMTPEASVVKLMHAAAYGRGLAGVRRILEANVAGERTPGT
ncbi:asparaginase [Vulgatibacter incomptus]|uniref:L-asparaginase I, cytoplasmic n=1 Tax=Vulgatibacter incomptus TaxID=1391653 RepID=A0A0K1P906_9BACT|nr:L-asparaginase I, cytoplasmic [Vulgatibacter incomptus]